MRLLPLLGLCLFPIASCLALPLRKLNPGACLAIRFNSSKTDVNLDLRPTVMPKFEHLYFHWAVNGTDSSLQYTRELAVHQSEKESVSCKSLTFDDGGFTNIYIKHDKGLGGWKMNNEKNWTYPMEKNKVIAKELKPDFFTLHINDEKKGHLQTIAHCD